MKSKLNILVIFDSAGTPPEDQDFSEHFKAEDWFTEAAVVETLGHMGHCVRPLGIYDDIGLLVDAVRKERPDVVFNLAEIFLGKANMDKNIPAVLETLDVPYTGCGPDAMALCNNKALTKKILAYHKIRVPGFHTFRKGRRVWIPGKLSFPMVVKPLQEEASTGIAQASRVSNEQQFLDRIAYIHDNLNMHAIAEEYVPGRELYVSVMGRHRLTAFPIREMVFGDTGDEAPRMATFKAKFDEAYRKRWGITNIFPLDLDPVTTEKVLQTCKRAYRALSIDSYARFDCRLTEEGRLYILEANANPELAQGEEFAESAEKAGMTYDQVLDALLRMAFARYGE